MCATKSKPDRRVQRTRELLLDALFALMIKRGYERLTIQDLLDRSGVGRATFYAHFKSKDDLLASSVARLRGTLEQARQTRPGQRMGFTLPLFQHMASLRSIYLMTVVPESEVSVQQHFRRMLRDLVRDDLATRRCAGRDDASVDLATHYVVGALWSTIVWWMDSASTLPPERINAVFQRLTFPGLDVTLGQAA
ncbi:MAG: transcriptional regulator, TetR family [Gammaproteobacteria bacterium]|jgi:AcrR family transcriptional regulator|nr:transcriptional regulator, TetR family [Gammaproteobacteria bacterium]